MTRAIADLGMILMLIGWVGGIIWNYLYFPGTGTLIDYIPWLIPFGAIVFVYGMWHYLSQFNLSHVD